MFYIGFVLPLNLILIEEVRETSIGFVKVYNKLCTQTRAVHYEQIDTKFHKDKSHEKPFLSFGRTAKLT